VIIKNINTLLKNINSFGPFFRVEATFHSGKLQLGVFSSKSNACNFINLLNQHFKDKGVRGMPALLFVELKCLELSSIPIVVDSVDIEYSFKRCEIYYRH